MKVQKPALVLTAISVAIIALIMGTGFYRQWFLSAPASYWAEVVRQCRKPTTRYEAQARLFGRSYTVSMHVKQFLKSTNAEQPVVLFEPNAYYKDKQIPFYAPEPVVFYYYTGLRSVWMNSKDVYMANYLVRVTGKAVHIEPIRSREELQRILSGYSKYKPAL